MRYPGSAPPRDPGPAAAHPDRTNAIDKTESLVVEDAISNLFVLTTFSFPAERLGDNAPATKSLRQAPPLKPAAFIAGLAYRLNLTRE